MPRRKRDYFPPGSFFVDGVRHQSQPGSTILGVGGDGVSIFDRQAAVKNATAKAALRSKVTGVAKFAELSQIPDMPLFIDDLLDVVTWDHVASLDYLVRGSRSKPTEWNLTILFRSVAIVMAKHGLAPTIGDYEATRGGRSRRRSFYLRLAAEIAKAAGHRLPKDVKGLALRASKIHVEAVHVLP